MEQRDDWRETLDWRPHHGPDVSFAAAMRTSRTAMVLTDPRLPDNPIVFANDAFLAMTGYGLAEVLGRNCRFLQGPGTDPASVAAIGHAVEHREPIAIDIMNYRKDGSPFLNALQLSPVADREGASAYFVGFQLDRTTEIHRDEAALLLDRERVRRIEELEGALHLQTLLIHEIDHRVKNNLQMVSSMLMLQAMRVPDPVVGRTLREMLERIDALGIVHKKLYEASEFSRFDVAALARDIAQHIIGVSGRLNIRVDLQLQPLVIEAEAAGALALILNEALTNAVKHAFGQGRPGTLTLATALHEGVGSVVVTDDGPGFTRVPESADSFGTTLVETLARQLDATLSWRPGHPGTVFSIDFPIRRPPLSALPR